MGALSPSFGFENDEKENEKIVELINLSKATVLVVGVGAPKQEKWIMKHRSEFRYVKIFLPLGATIDFISGRKKIAPKIFSYIGLEWFFRLVSEPKRLIIRYLKDFFVLLDLIATMKGTKN